MNNLITHKLHSIVFLMDKIANSLLKSKFGIDFSHFSVIQSIYTHKAINQKSICLWTGFSKGMVSRIINNLNESKILIVKNQKTDKRFNTISLTKNGEKLAGESNQYLEAEFTGNILTPQKGINVNELNKSIDNIIENLNTYSNFNK